MNKVMTTQNDYVFDKSRELPTGELKLTVLRGDAWVFTGDSNFIVRKGEQRILPVKSKPAIIRRAFTRGFAKYQVEVVA